MKRKASLATDNGMPVKLKKESTSKTPSQILTQLKKMDTAVKPSAQWPSFSSPRQRKAPSWLASYVTNSVQEKEVKKEAVKPKMLKAPTVSPASKDKDVSSTKIKLDDDKSEEQPVLLRRKSTIKVERDIKASNEKKGKEISSMKPSLKTSASKEKLFKRQTVNPTSVKEVTKESKTKSSNGSSIELHPKPKKTVSHTKNSAATSLTDKSINVSSTKVVEICDDKNFSSTAHLANANLLSKSAKGLQSSALKPTKAPSIVKPSLHNATTLLLPEPIRPTMLEVVICISTSGALREYLAALQDSIREMIWRVQSLVPNLRIGIMAHTQGGIHDDQKRSSCGSGDHNYNRVGGHSGTKWLDLGATMSQICAFVDSLESESTVYPNYVQDNLEMALWKLQRCMSWSSCSYRTVIMIGHGRPNRTSFYMQKEHWRSWIRSALELRINEEIPVIDWELEAKLLASMGIHLFTIQVAVDTIKPKEEDEGTLFFRRVAEITQGQHVRISDPSRLLDIILGICCACHGPDLLLDHRDTVRDDNDGILPSQLTEVFISLQLHSKSCSLASLPSMLGNLDIAGIRQRLNNSQDSMIMECSDEEEGAMEYDLTRHSLPMEISEPESWKLKSKMTTLKKDGIRLKDKNNAIPDTVKKLKGQKLKEKESKNKKRFVENHLSTVKDGRIGRKNPIVKSSKNNKKVKMVVKSITQGKVVNGTAKRLTSNIADRRKKGNTSSIKTSPQRNNSTGSGKPIGKPILNKHKIQKKSNEHENKTKKNNRNGVNKKKTQKRGREVSTRTEKDKQAKKSLNIKRKASEPSIENKRSKITYSKPHPKGEPRGQGQSQRTSREPLRRYSDKGVGRRVTGSVLQRALQLKAAKNQIQGSVRPIIKFSSSKPKGNQGKYSSRLSHPPQNKKISNIFAEKGNRQGMKAKKVLDSKTFSAERTTGKSLRNSPASSSSKKSVKVITKRKVTSKQ